MFEYQNERGQDQATEALPAANADDSRCGLASAAFVMGIVACSLNILLITAPIGLIFSFAAFILGLIAYIQQKHYSGLVLSLISFLILFIWAASWLVMIWMDPTLGINLQPFNHDKNLTKNSPPGLLVLFLYVFAH